MEQYFYRLSYTDYDGGSSEVLLHTCLYSEKEFNRMVANCTLESIFEQIKEFNQVIDLGLTPHEQIISLLQEKFGFSLPKYEADSHMEASIDLGHYKSKQIRTKLTKMVFEEFEKAGLTKIFETYFERHLEPYLYGEPGQKEWALGNLAGKAFRVNEMFGSRIIQKLPSYIYLDSNE